MATTRDTLRFYDQKNLLKSKRNANNYRQYSESDQITFKIIHNLQHAGLTIAEIKSVLFLREQPVTSDCHDETVKLIQSKRNEFHHEQEFYNSSKRLTDEMLNSLSGDTDQDLNQLIEQLGNL
ncbi:hypothetical protein IV57_GL001185 [Companilactobacillus kimchiensis]|uniref:HTH merR-type domain-containing protein n=2 Tax=Companilactobacillus kimchiensis TaxID=993692 RepID=A0A0R2LJR5_9LACO|nr:hypothetical protein IV57_GL001185 [Companilactobacillus kimchiensis]